MAKTEVKTKPDSAPSTLVELRAENFKRLKAVRVTPKGAGVTTISGRNEQGKSSVLDAVMAAIGGKDAMPPRPINSGESEATIHLDFGDMKITRRIWNKKGGGIGHEVVLEYADGRRPQATQAVLDRLRGSSLADDPLEFSRLDKKKQFDLLRPLVKGYDFEDRAKERKRLFDERTQVGRDFDRAKGVVDSIPIAGDAKTEIVDVAALAAELRAVSDHNSTVDSRQKRRDEARDKIDELRDKADLRRAEAKKMDEEADALAAKLEEAEDLPERKDATAIERQISEAETINETRRRNAERRRKVIERDDLEEKYSELTKKIDAIDAAKSAAIAAAELPVDGLDFGDEEILLDGLPFDQASTARKIRVATSLLMALKPDLRVLLVREGSLLDEDMRAALDDEARKNGFVVLMECVGDGAGGIVIEDGEVA